MGIARIYSVTWRHESSLSWNDLMIPSNRSAELFQWRLVVSEDQLIFYTFVSVCFQFKGATIQRLIPLKNGVTEVTLAITSLKICDK